MYDILLLILLQYTILVYLLIKKSTLVDSKSIFGITLWIPVIGPLAVLILIICIIMFILPLLIPLAIINSIVWMLNKLTKLKLGYL